MKKVTSKDGTTIAFDQAGKGQPVILVDGALCYRSFGPMPKLASLLEPHFNVIAYDRRGRGDSSNSKPYSVEREVEDIDALIQEAGGKASVYGISSGGALALEAAIKLGDRIRKLAVYEAPYNSEDAARQQYREYRRQLSESLKAGRNGDAVVLFMNLVGTPSDQVEGMRHAPVWPMFEAVAPTLAYDAATLGDDRSVPAKRVSAISVPTLIMDGGANHTLLPFMSQSAKALAGAIPNARRRTLDGQTHDVSPEAIAPVLMEFFAA